MLTIGLALDASKLSLYTSPFSPAAKSTVSAMSIQMARIEVLKDTSHEERREPGFRRDLRAPIGGVRRKECPKSCMNCPSMH